LTNVRLLSLKNQKAFDSKSKEAVRYSCRFFTIFLSKFSNDEHIITSKKIDETLESVIYGFKISRKIGNSVARNLLKRRLKNIYLKFFQVNYHKVSIIFIPKQAIKDIEYNLLEEEMFRAINWALKRV
jgi:ribonuclease P protein component